VPREVEASPDTVTSDVMLDLAVVTPAERSRVRARSALAAQATSDDVDP